MAGPAAEVFVYRCGKWEDRPIEELLPGDLISLHTKCPDSSFQIGGCIRMVNGRGWWVNVAESSHEF